MYGDGGSILQQRIDAGLKALHHKRHMVFRDITREMMEQSVGG